MANSGAIRAGRAFIELYLDQSKMNIALNKASDRLKSWQSQLSDIGSTLGVAGAGITAPLLAAAKIFADAGSSIKDMSDRTGIAVEQLSTLKYAADQSGTSMETFEGGIKAMQKTIAAAGDGSQEASEKLGAIGLSVSQLSGMSPDQQFLAIADGIASIQGPADRASAAMRIFGGSGAELIPIMLEGSAGIAALQARARELGLQMSSQDAKAAEEFGDQLQTLEAQIQKVGFAVGSALLPTLAEFAEKAQVLIPQVISWVSENKEAVTILLQVGAALAAAGIAFKGLSLAVGVAKGAIDSFVAVLSFGGPVGAAVLILAGLTAAYVALGDEAENARKRMVAAANAIDPKLKEMDARTAEAQANVDAVLARQARKREVAAERGPQANWAPTAVDGANDSSGYNSGVVAQSLDPVQSILSSLTSGLEKIGAMSAAKDALGIDNGPAYGVGEIITGIGNVFSGIADNVAEAGEILGDQVPGLKEAQAGVLEAINSTAGTFDGMFAGQQLGADKTPEQILAANREGNRTLVRIERAVANQGKAT